MIKKNIIIALIIMTAPGYIVAQSKVSNTVTKNDISPNNSKGLKLGGFALEVNIPLSIPLSSFNSRYDIGFGGLSIFTWDTIPYLYMSLLSGAYIYYADKSGYKSRISIIPLILFLEPSYTFHIKNLYLRVFLRIGGGGLFGITTKSYTPDIETSLDGVFYEGVGLGFDHRDLPDGMEFIFTIDSWFSTERISAIVLNINLGMKYRFYTVHPEVIKNKNEKKDTEKKRKRQEEKKENFKKL